MHGLRHDSEYRTVMLLGYIKLIVHFDYETN
jgi:hypothetical protein